MLRVINNFLYDPDEIESGEVVEPTTINAVDDVCNNTTSQETVIESETAALSNTITNGVPEHIEKNDVTSQNVETVIAVATSVPGNTNLLLTPMSVQSPTILPVIGKEKAKKILKALSSQNKYTSKQQLLNNTATTPTTPKESRKKEKKPLTPHEKAQETIDEIEQLKRTADRTVPRAYYNEAMIHHITIDQDDIKNDRTNNKSNKRTSNPSNQLHTRDSCAEQKINITPLKIYSLEAIKAYSNTGDRHSDDEPPPITNNKLDNSSNGSSGIVGSSVALENKMKIQNRSNDRETNKTVIDDKMRRSTSTKSKKDEKEKTNRPTSSREAQRRSNSSSKRNSRRGSRDSINNR